MHVREPTSFLIKLLGFLTDTAAAMPKPLTAGHIIRLSTPLRATEISIWDGKTLL